MRITIRRIYRTSIVAVVLAGAGLLAVAAPASARPASKSVIPVMARITTVFDLNGTYTDGRSARPRVTDVSDILTIDMSSQHRPPATGLVINADTIQVTFPDDATYSGKLLAPGLIRWSNGSAWQKLVFVPDVVGLPTARAVTAVQSAGLTAVTHNESSCDTLPGHVSQQLPAAGAQAVPGSLVHVFIAVKPRTCS
jgi:hypothetical protein